jgi:predicted RNA-binding Zn-ribbon protein involved in translation (DUF1610 family)
MNETIICPNCGEENIRNHKTCSSCSINLLLNNRYQLLKDFEFHLVG